MELSWAHKQHWGQHEAETPALFWESLSVSDLGWKEQILPVGVHIYVCVSTYVCVCASRNGMGCGYGCVHTLVYVSLADSQETLGTFCKSFWDQLLLLF